jgi:hypothetical protein
MLPAGLDLDRKSHGRPSEADGDQDDKVCESLRTARHAFDRQRGDVAHELLPPLRPAAAFCARFPPLPRPLLRLLRLLPPPPERLPPLLDASGVFAIAAARPLLMPFLRRPSYCLSSLTDEP